jgi:hypothetical protein
MSLNPTLKYVLVKTAYIVGSLLTVLILLIWYPIGEHHKTLIGIWQFVITLTIIWFNIRKLAKPIQLVTIGMYLFLFAVIMFWYKTEPFPRWFYDFPSSWGQFCNYRMMRILCCIGFILLASILPIFLKSTDAPRLTKFGTIWIWATILMLDFAVAMPNIYFTEEQGDKLYRGFHKMGTVNKYVPIYAVGIGDYFKVLIPQDSVDTFPEYYLSVHYERHGNLLIQPEIRDTIWIEKGGARPNPDRKTIENNTSCQMRWQWQYYAWHKIKGIFCKEENE